MSSPSSPAYIGVDVGSSGCKAVLIEGRRVTAEAWASYPTVRSADGAATQDARAWLRALETTVRRCAAAHGTIEGLCITAPAHNAVLVEPDGSPRYPVVLWSDSRPAPVARELRASLGAAYTARTNVRLDGTWTLPQLVWLRRRQPAALRGLAHILVGKDYLRFCLTGIAATDPTDAAGTAMYDPFAETWLDDLPELGRIADLLPPVAAATAHGGSLAAGAARRLGLRRGTPLVVGATDTACELISVGAVENGASLVKIATTGTVVVVTRTPPRSELLLTYPHPLGDMWYSVAATSSAAAAYTWLAHSLDGNRSNLKRMDAIARRVPAGADGVLFLPFLEGERTPYWDRDLRAAFLGLSAAHDRRHLYRAVLEGVALSLRSCWQTQLAAGARPTAPALTGGGLASKLWREIVVSAIGVPGRRTEPQGPALGAALLAARGLSGVEPRVTQRSVEHVPDPDWAATYAALHEVYADAAASVRAASHRLVHLSRTAPNDRTAGTR